MGHSNLQNKSLKLPSYVIEVSTLSTNLFFLKLYSEESFTALSYFIVLLPFMVYLIITLFQSLLKFI
jgi:hypothetical protein